MAEEREGTSTKANGAEGVFDITVRLDRAPRGARALNVKISAQSTAFRVADILFEFGHYPSFQDFIERELRVACEKFFADAAELLKNAAPQTKAKTTQSR